MKRSNATVIALAFIAFVSLGLPDGLLGVAWPGVRRHFSLPVDALGLFLVFSIVGYMTASFSSGALVRKFGVGWLLAASCAATGIALLVYSIAPAWWVFVAFGLLGGAGAGAIDAGLNNYIDRNHSERLMQWLHASFGVGITLGPIIMTAGLGLTGRWQPGYRLVAFAQLVLAAAFLLTRREWRTEGGAGQDAPQSAGTGHGIIHGTADEAPLAESILHIPSLVSMLLFFLYTGSELGLGIWAFTLLTEARGVSETVAGIVTGGYWASFTAGRILAGLYSSSIRVERLVSMAIVAAMLGVLLVLIDAGPAVTVAGIAVTGFAVAPVFPGMLSDTRNRVDRRHLSNTIGMQIAAAGLGAAGLPALAGIAARFFGLEIIPVSIFVTLAVLLILFLVSHQALRRRRIA